MAPLTRRCSSARRLASRPICPSARPPACPPGRPAALPPMRTPSSVGGMALPPRCPSVCDPSWGQAGPVQSVYCI